MERRFDLIVCDDDAKFLEELLKRVVAAMEKSGYEYNITPMRSGIDLIEYCQENMVDIVLVDIDMPKLTGFEAVQQLQKHQPDLPVIFVTAHEEYAFQAYNYQPFWFVSKRQLDRLDDVILKLVKKLICRYSSNEIFHLKLDKIYGINVNEIMYFRSDKHYVSAYTVNGKDASYRCTVREAYSQLAEVGYIYIHRSYIVNCRYIKQFDPQFVLLSNGEKISVTRNSAILREAQKLYGKFMRDRRW